VTKRNEHADCTDLRFDTYVDDAIAWEKFLATQRRVSCVTILGHSEGASVSAPVLILQGTTDLQVSVADAKLLAAGHPGAKVVLLDGVNHVLKRAPADRAANISTYSESNLPLAPDVVPIIADFVNRVSRK
jgi:pimeloyl-ACP methyl ester carboxylesterase